MLIIDQPDQHALNVVQACDDMTFFGPEDILLDNEHIGFAQPWNRYTLRKSDLGFYFGSVTKKMLEKLAGETRPEAHELQPGSLLWFFRQMEVETGFFFASRAMQALMGHYEKENVNPDDSSPGDLLQYRNTSELMADIHHLPLTYPELQQQDVPLSETLAVLQPKVELLPRAAQDSRDNVTGLVFNIEQNRIRTVEPLEIIVQHQECHGGMLHVSGQIPAADEDSMTFLFYWHCDAQLQQIRRREYPWRIF